MINQASPEIRQHLREMCAQLTVDQHLDDEVQRELYGHMEDKLLAYLNGEEVMSEDDALILVREHFGDPAVIKGLLQAVRPMAAGKAFLRRAAAILCTYTVIMALTDRLIMWDLLCISQMAPLPRPMVFLGPFVPQALDLTAVFLLWVILTYWQRRSDAGHPVWFFEWSGWILAVLCAGLLVADQVLPTAKVGPPPAAQALHQTWNHYYLPLVALTSACSVCLSLVCIWWCDRSPRLKAAVFLSCCLWAAFMFLRTLLPTLMSITWWGLVTFPVRQDVRFPVEIVISQFRHLQNVAVNIAVCTVLSLVLYAAFNRMMRRKAGTC